MPVEQPPPPTPQALLDEARSAWRMKRRAEAELARLRRYTHMSKAMKRDHSSHYAQMTEADAILSRILGGAP